MSSVKLIFKEFTDIIINIIIIIRLFNRYNINKISLLKNTLLIKWNRLKGSLKDN